MGFDQRSTYPTYSRYEIFKLVRQKLIGAVIIAMCIWFLKLVAGTGEDAAGVVLVAPVGLFLLLSRRIWIV